MSKYDNSFRARLGRFIKRLLNGTLTERIRNNKEYIKDKHWNEFQESIDNTIIGTLPLGAKIKLYKDDKLSKSIFFETFEKGELRFLANFLREEDTFLDIGANIGLFSLVAGKVVKNTGRVYAFEPAKNTFEKLRENILLNKITHIYPQNVAISNTNAVVEMSVSHNGYDAWNSLAIPKEGYGFVKESVNTITLDYFVESENLKRIDLIKIDVEGWEIPLLEGAKKLLNNKEAPVLMIEFTDECARNAGFTCKQLYEKLLLAGYKLYEYDYLSNQLHTHQPQDYYNYTNLIATKDFERLRFRLRPFN